MSRQDHIFCLCHILHSDVYTELLTWSSSFSESQIHREEVKFIGQGTENSSSSRSSSRIRSTLMPKKKSVALFLNFRYFTSLRSWSTAFLELRFLVWLLPHIGNSYRGPYSNTKSNLFARYSLSVCQSPSRSRKHLKVVKLYCMSVSCSQ